MGKSQESRQNEKSREKLSRSEWKQRNLKNKENINGAGKSQRNEKQKEKLGGLIFLCSAKTKPDCFHYHVMGVSNGKKDLVIGIKPGLKLFLYDFELKLLYGIYKASSSGGMKLEPKAFHGAFPAQVRFNVQMDCFPLPESVFKRAIKENYNEKNKFRTELTIKQVRKLTELFRPAEFHQIERTIPSPRRTSIRDKNHRSQDPYSDSTAKTHDRDRRIEHKDGIPHERDRIIEYKEKIPRERDLRIEYREQIPRERERKIEHREVVVPRQREEYYPSAKEYEAYGLRPERRYLEPCPYPKDYEREQHLIRHPDHSIRDDLSVQRETVRVNPPLYLIGSSSYHRDYREIPSTTTTMRSHLSGLKESYPLDPYHASQYGVSSSVDPYLPPSTLYSASGRSYMTKSDPVQRREMDRPDRFYSTYSSPESASYYDQTLHRWNTKREDAVAMPVSSRYSFASPLHSYR